MTSFWSHAYKSKKGVDSSQADLLKNALKFSRVTRSRLLIGEIPVYEKISSNFSIYTLQKYVTAGNFTR